MKPPDSRPSRRTLMKVAGSGLAAGALAKLAPASAAAQPTTGSPWSADYWAKKGDVSLYLFRKRAGAPVKGEPPRPVLFLAHGSSISSRPTFDLSVPGKGEYSLMNVFAGYGFDVWTMDHESYGRSARTEGNSDIRSGAEDLMAGSALVPRGTGQTTRPSRPRWSSGASTTGSPPSRTCSTSTASCPIRTVSSASCPAWRIRWPSASTGSSSGIARTPSSRCPSRRRSEAPRARGSVWCHKCAPRRGGPTPAGRVRRGSHVAPIDAQGNFIRRARRHRGRGPAALPAREAGGAQLLRHPHRSFDHARRRQEGRCRRLGGGEEERLVHGHRGGRSGRDPGLLRKGRHHPARERAGRYRQGAIRGAVP